MYYVKVWKLNDWWIMFYFEYGVDALTIKWKIISKSKETSMKRKREAFGKVLFKLSWFLLISGLNLILACRSWSQIRVSGLGRDINSLSIPSHSTTHRNDALVRFEQLQALELGFYGWGFCLWCVTNHT